MALKSFEIQTRPIPLFPKECYKTYRRRYSYLHAVRNLIEVQAETCLYIEHLAYAHKYMKKQSVFERMSFLTLRSLIIGFLSLSWKTLWSPLFCFCLLEKNMLRAWSKPRGKICLFLPVLSGTSLVSNVIFSPWITVL